MIKIGRALFYFNKWIGNNIELPMYLNGIIFLTLPTLTLIFITKTLIPFIVVTTFVVFYIKMRINYIKGRYDKYKLTNKELEVKRGRELRDKKIKNILRKF